MSMGNEIKELTAKVEELEGVVSEQATAIEGYEATIEAAAQLDNDKAEATIEAAQAHEEQVKGLEAELQEAQEALAGALEVNDGLIEDAEAAEEKVTLAEAAVEEAQAAVVAKDAKLENPAIKDASAEGEDEAADLDVDEPKNILEEYNAIADPAQKQSFWRENKQALREADVAARKEAKEKE